MMEELFQAPTDDVGDAIVVPLILANQFELKIGLLNLVTAVSFHGFANDDPYSRFRSVIQNRQRNLDDPSLLLDFEEINMNPNNVQGLPPLGPPPQNHNAYQVGLESVEARIVIHQKNEAVYEEDIALLKLKVQLRDTALVTLRQKLEKAEYERGGLKLKLEKFKRSNNLVKLIGSQFDANNKTGLGYGNHVNGCEANDSKSVSDEEDSPVNDRFMKSNRNHAIPHHYTGNYMPPRADLSFAGLDDSVYKCKVTESISNESKVETNVTKSCTYSIKNQRLIGLVPLLLKSGNQTVIMRALLVLSVTNQNILILRLILLNLLSVLNVVRMRNKRKNLRVSLKILRSLSHLIRDCTFHEDRMAKKFVGQGTGQRGTRPVWDNTTRVNHPNKLTRPHPKRNFIPVAILTKFRQVPVNAAKQSSHKAAASVSAARRVNTAAPRPNVNRARPKTTQDLVIIKLIQRVKRLERELKARIPPIKIQKRLYAKEQAQFKREQRIARERAAEQEATYQDLLNSIVGRNLLTQNTQEALTIIKNKSKVRTFRNKPQVSSASASSSQNDAIIALTKQVEALVSSMTKPIHFIQEGCKTCGGLHSYYTQDVYATTGNYNLGEIRKALQERHQGVVPSNTVPNPREDIKVITIRSGMTLAGPSVPSLLSSFYKEVERDPKTITNRLNKEKLQDKFNIQIHSFLQMFKKLHYNISSPEALAYMPKYAKMVKDLLTNKEKLLEQVNTPLNENCSAVILKKLPEKLRYTGRFLIPCDFQELESCMALVDLGASIKLMPLSVWKKLILLELTPTRMTLELATWMVSYPAGIAEDIFIQMGKFTFPADFVVVDYNIDPRVPLILGRPFLRTARALVDVHKEELTLQIETLIEDPPDLELNDLPPHLEYAFLEETSKLPVIIAKDLKKEEKEQLLKVLKSHKQAIA
nr:hypothetical protein [Tanacetum cinerariifolium]